MTYLLLTLSLLVLRAGGAYAMDKPEAELEGEEPLQRTHAIHHFDQDNPNKVLTRSHSIGKLGQQAEGTRSLSSSAGIRRSDSVGKLRAKVNENRKAGPAGKVFGVKLEPLANRPIQPALFQVKPALPPVIPSSQKRAEERTKTTAFNPPARQTMGIQSALPDDLRDAFTQKWILAKISEIRKSVDQSKQSSQYKLDILDELKDKIENLPKVLSAGDIDHMEKILKYSSPTVDDVPFLRSCEMILNDLRRYWPINHVEVKWTKDKHGSWRSTGNKSEIGDNEVEKSYLAELKKVLRKNKVLRKYRYSTMEDIENKIKEAKEIAVEKNEEIAEKNEERERSYRVRHYTEKERFQQEILEYIHGDGELNLRAYIDGDTEKIPLKLCSLRWLGVSKTKVNKWELISTDANGEGNYEKKEQ